FPGATDSYTLISPQMRNEIKPFLRHEHCDVAFRHGNAAGPSRRPTSFADRKRRERSRSVSRRSRPGAAYRRYLMLSLCKPPKLPRTKTLKARQHRSSSDRFGSTECITTDGNRHISLVLGR